ncbi:hypothetical protein, partial [Xanthomonas euvesicatoria]|uniref:hypothetical protein n=1 Tax=Xanthomonas euvesicatoria TaxID=456327 RepID=UPI0019D31B2A
RLQRGDDLAIGELALAHWWSPWWLVCPETSSYGWIKFTGSRHKHCDDYREYQRYSCPRPYIVIFIFLVRLPIHFRNFQ